MHVLIESGLTINEKRLKHKPQSMKSPRGPTCIKKHKHNYMFFIIYCLKHTQLYFRPNSMILRIRIAHCLSRTYS